VQRQLKIAKTPLGGCSMLTVASLVAPIVILALAIVVGVMFNYAPVKQRRHKPISIVVFAGVVGVVGLVFTFLLSNILSDYFFSFGLFGNFSSVFQDVGVDIIKYNPQIAAALVLLGMLEAGLSLGFGGAYSVTTMKLKRQKANTSNPSPIVDVAAKVAPAQSIEATTGMLEKDDEDSDVAKDDPGLRRDERSMIELFIYGKVSQISPTVDAAKPDGYYFDGIPQLDWDTKHTRQILDALVRKNFLKAELIDKIIVCKNCDSGKVRVVKTCPECGSLRLRKEGLIEHFSCGAVDRQSAFESPSGDLVCPKCKAKLHLIGSDYRVLPPAYKCLGCNTLNNAPRLITKCSECESTEDFDDEPEIMLYKYTANAQMPLKELHNIKPIEKTAEFFKSLGYSIVAPAYVSGKSGTQHLFDMLILGRVGWVDGQNQKTGSATNRSDNGNTAVEALVSSKPVSLGAITRIYGKISDIDSDFLLFTIPGLTANARNYAKAYDMKISEGKDIEEALANSKIPKVKSGKA